MTHLKIRTQTEIIYRFLAHKQLKNAFDALIQLMYENNLLQFKDRLDELQTTYKYMLQYTVESANDPERQKIYNKLFVDTFRMGGEMEQDLLDKHSSQLPYSLINTTQRGNLKSGIEALIAISSQYQMVRLSPENEIPYDIKMNYQQRMSELFMIFWSTHFYTEDFAIEIKSLVQKDALKEYELAIISSAVTLSLWRNFDSRKFDVLFELASASSDLVRQRAYVGILIAIYIYSDRLPFFSKILARFSILSENKEFIKSLENIIMQFIRSKESEKIAKRFSEEIIPEMAKISPQMRDKLNMIRDENDQSDDEEKNPDWQELLDEVPGLTDKMKEITEMQLEGADVFLSTFSMLKTFPFFNTIHNWLVPFNVEYPEIVEETMKDDNKAFVQAIGKSHFLCNSDKYSFMLSMQQLPETQKRQMASSIGAEFEGMKEIEKDETSLNKSRTSEFISNQYVQDLYRLFNIHPRKADFDNIFRKRLDFHNKTSIAQLIEDPKVWRNVAEYYFAKNYFDEAAELYDSFLDKDSANSEVLQKRGYCAQKKGDFKTALTFYLKADLVESDNSWTIKKIAYCYRAIDDAENALKFYKQASALQPKNYSTQLSTGHCFLSLKKYDDALNAYFKIELESSKPQRVWRPIAWASFVDNKLDQAKRYYVKILDNKPTPHDYINAGHTELASQQNQKALEYYKIAVQGLDGDLDKFLSILKEDKPYILSYGVEESDLPILLDSLRYKLE